MQDNFDLKRYLRHGNKLLNENNLGGYFNMKSLNEFDENASNDWMQSVNDASIEDNGWVCNYSGNALEWTNDQLPGVVVSATPGFDSEDRTPIQVEVNGETVDTDAIDQISFDSFEDYADAMQPVLAKVASEHGGNTNNYREWERDGVIWSTDGKSLIARPVNGRLSAQSIDLKQAMQAADAGTTLPSMLGAGREDAAIVLSHVMNYVPKKSLNESIGGYVDLRPINTLYEFDESEENLGGWDGDGENDQYDGKYDARYGNDITNEELFEGEGEVLEVYDLCIKAMRAYIKKYGLDDEDVQQLREKLAKFYS